MAFTRKLHDETGHEVYFKKEINILKAIGIPLNSDQSFKYKIYSFLIIFGCNTLYPILEVREMWIHEFDVIANILIYEFAAVAALMKTVALWLNRLKIGKILDKLQQPPFTPNVKRGGPKEKELILECNKYTNIQTNGYILAGVTAFSIAVLASIYKRLRSNDPHDWDFAYGPLTILNVTHSPNFEISLLYQSVAIFFIASHFIMIDLITATVLMHICYQFKILQNNIRKIVEDAFVRKALGCDRWNLKRVIQIPYEDLNRCLEEAVRYHLAIIAIATEMEEVFSLSILIIYLGTLGMLCFTVYHASMFSLSDFHIIRSLAEALCMCLQVLTVCFWGEQVMFESQEVSKAAYDTNFVGSDIKFQKNLVLIMRRSRNSIKLTAGKFADVCLTTFTWIMRASYSAFMVLRSSSGSEK